MTLQDSVVGWDDGDHCTLYLQEVKPEDITDEQQKRLETVKLLLSVTGAEGPAGAGGAVSTLQKRICNGYTTSQLAACNVPD